MAFDLTLSVIEQSNLTEKLTLGVKKNKGIFTSGGILLSEVVNLKDTLKVLDIILTMWWYYITPNKRNNLEKRKLTLHVVTNEDDFPDGSEIGEKRDIVSNFYLGGFINHNSVKRISFEDTLFSQYVTREHTKGTEHNWAALKFREPPKKFTTGDGIGPNGSI